MYRVIIADDEPDICAGMRTLIDWEALGFEVAGTAEKRASGHGAGGRTES